MTEFELKNQNMRTIISDVFFKYSLIKTHVKSPVFHRKYDVCEIEVFKARFACYAAARCIVVAQTEDTQE